MQKTNAEFSEVHKKQKGWANVVPWVWLGLGIAITILGPVLRECFPGEVTFERIPEGSEKGVTGLCERNEPQAPLRLDCVWLRRAAVRLEACEADLGGSVFGSLWSAVPGEHPSFAL